jgi:hypothetical protein
VELGVIWLLQRCGFAIDRQGCAQQQRSLHPARSGRQQTKYLVYDPWQTHNAVCEFRIATLPTVPKLTSYAGVSVLIDSAECILLSKEPAIPLQ